MIKNQKMIKKYIKCKKNKKLFYLPLDLKSKETIPLYNSRSVHKTQKIMTTISITMFWCQCRFENFSLIIKFHKSSAIEQCKYLSSMIHLNKFTGTHLFIQN